ncbi:MAG: BON domain-containing protein [Nitrospirota bacterium]
MIKRYLSAAFAVMALATIASCAATATTRSSGEYLDDKAISAKVKADLIGDPVVKAAQIDINTYKGIVQLSGFVDSRAAVIRAGEIARKTKGVISVKNNLQLRSSTP